MFLLQRQADNDDDKENVGIIIDRDEIKEFIKDKDKDKDKNGQYRSIDKVNVKWHEKGFTSNWNYDLRLGDEVYLSSKELPIKLTEHDNVIAIRSGEFALLITREKVELPKDVMAFISVRFKYKQKGLINISGFHVDPGYRGKLIFSVYNAGPNDILLKKDEAVFMIFFQRMLGEIEKEKERKEYECIPLEMMTGIQGRSASLAANAEKIGRLEYHIKVLAGAMTVTITVLIGAIIKIIF